jgi:hypothetical protein
MANEKTVMRVIPWPVDRVRSKSCRRVMSRARARRCTGGGINNLWPR